MAATALLSALAPGGPAYAYGGVLILLGPELIEPISLTSMFHVMPGAAALAVVLGVILGALRPRRVSSWPFVLAAAIAVPVNFALVLGPRTAFLIIGVLVSGVVTPAAVTTGINALLTPRAGGREGA
jgi:hypothetical protein